MTAKEPGPGGIRLKPVSLDLNYTDTFQRPSPDAYERLLMDVVAGDPTLFMRRDEVEAAWAWAERSSSAGNSPSAAHADTPQEPAVPPTRPPSSSATAVPGTKEQHHEHHPP